ncbi:MAG: S8 family serine peptidase [Chloroflexota bacterium]|nr:S8 family serine peptidase [Chloroflexota bacterium]
MRNMWTRIVTLVVALALSLGLAGLAGPFARSAVAAGPEIDPLLTRQLDAAVPAASLQAILTYDHRPTATDVAAARATGALVHEFSALPMLAVQGTPDQIRATFGLAGLTSVYFNRQLEYLMHESVTTIGADRVWGELGYTGKGVGVAVIDSGVDGAHPDIAFGGPLVQNVKIVGPNFFTGEDVILENQINTDTSSGHGTHVAGMIGGRGTASAGYYRGVAPDSNLVGIGAGDALFILFALQGFDWALAHQAEYNIRVISNSWGTTGEFAPGNPINVASKQAHDAGMTVVFAAGNEGPGENTLNPYSVAPWVIGVAAGNKDGRTLADFSSRGIPGDPLYHPTITAPGVRIASTRASTGTTINALTARSDLTGCVKTEFIAFYTCANGTSMATPHVSGVLALMLEANPKLHPDILKDLLIKTATPMAGYAEFEVGAGYVDAYAATKEAVHTSPKYGQYRDKSGKVYKTIAQTYGWSGVVGPSAVEVYTSDYKDIAIASGAVRLTVGVTWTNPVVDIDLYVYDPSGSQEGSSAQGLTASEETTIADPAGGTLPEGTHKAEVRGYITVAEPYSGTYTVEYIVGGGK